MAHKVKETDSAEFYGPTRVEEMPIWVRPFLKSLSLNANVTLACRVCEIDRSTPYKYRDVNPVFAKMWREAEAEGADVLEAEAWRRAVEGYDRPVYQSGVLVGTVREFSDTLMQTLLKGHKPDKYRERVSTEHSAPGGGPMELKVYDASDAGRAKALQELLDAARARAAGAPDSNANESA